MKEIVEHLNENRQVELAKSILESKGYKVNKKLKESKVTDYISSDELHDIMNTTKEFGDFSHYQQQKDMIIRTTKTSKYSNIGPHGAVGLKNRYWKFIKDNEGNFEVYEVNSSGEKIGKKFTIN